MYQPEARRVSSALGTVAVGQRSDPGVLGRTTIRLGTALYGHDHWAVENTYERRIKYVAHNPGLLAQILGEGSGVATFS